VTAPRRRLALVAMVLLATTLAVLLRPVRREGEFHVPSAGEARRAEAMFGDLLGRAALGEGEVAAAQAGKFGLALQRPEQPGALSLAEPEGACSGRGVYLLREGQDLVPVALVAPHRGADLRTGEIAAAMFGEYPFAAAAWNSAPRRSGEGCGMEGEWGGDVTREPTHYLTAFSQAFARRHPQGRIVQLHGFDAARRQDQAAADADAIVSDGSRAPSGRLLDLADCMSAAFPERSIRVFPIDTEELGATTNAQGRVLREAGFAGFAHLELSAAFRKELEASAAARARLAACLGAGR
jgi:hypothetical protein